MFSTTQLIRQLLQHFCTWHKSLHFIKEHGKKKLPAKHIPKKKKKKTMNLGPMMSTHLFNMV